MTTPTTNGQGPSGCSILLVEDNLVNQKVLQKQLTKHGYRVQIANHGQEALDYLITTTAWRQQDPKEATPLPDLHVILMDIEMPVMDGMTCSKRIRELQNTGDILRHIPIVAVSANARAEQTKQALDAGMDDFITKPFRMPELTSVITKLLGTA
jgi:CheY-like chemotaxis protein